MTLAEIKKQFKDKKLFNIAMTHSSINNEKNNERLEFLGDRILGLSIADTLYKRYPNEDEGDLAKRHAALVCTKALATIARNIKLNQALDIIDQDMRHQTHILANTMEALIGAIYKDQGFATTHKMIQQLWNNLIDTFTEPPQDAKSTLQETVQKMGEKLPKYEIIKKEGEEHTPIFTVKVTTTNKSATGKGPTRKAAEQAAAEKMLHRLTK